MDLSADSGEWVVPLGIFKFPCASGLKVPALQILLEYSREERTRKHGIAVEATMRAYAQLLHEDVEKWGPEVMAA